MNDIEYILRIVLKARDEMAHVLAAARTELQAFAKSAQDSHKDFDGLNSRISSLSKRLGNLNNRFKESGAAIQEFASRKKDADKLIERNVELFGKLSNHVSKYGKELRNVGRDVDTTGRRVDRASQAVRGQERDVGKLRKAWQEIRSEFQGSHDNLSSLDNKLRSIGLLVVFAFAQQLISALTGLGGSLVAVAGSAAMAGGALGGTLVAGIAEALPMVGLLIGAFSRVSSVMDAVNQRQLAQKQSFVQQETAGKRVATATDQIANAHDSLTGSLDRVAEAERTLRIARRDGIRDLEDLRNATLAAELAAKGAAISQKDAQEQLRQAVRGGDVGGLAGAELGIEEAGARRRTVGQDLRRARQDERRVGGNIENLDSVRQARKALDDARDSADKADRSLQTAKRHAGEAVAGTESGAAALNFFLSQLSDSERNLYKNLLQLRETYKRVFRPITDVIIDSFSRTVSKVEGIIRMPKVVRTAFKLADSIATNMDKVVDAFTTDKSIGQFARIADQGAKNLGPLTDAWISFIHAFLNIAEDAGPALSALIGYIGDLGSRFEDLTGDHDAVENFFSTGERHLEAWVELGLAAVNLFFALTGAGGGATGLDTVKDATTGINELTEKVRDNAEGVGKFFEDSRQVLDDVFRVVKALAIEIFKSFDADRVGHFADFLIEVVIPALGEVIRKVGWVTSGIADFLSLPIISWVAKWGLVLVIMAQTASTVVLASKYFGGLLKIFAPLVRGFDIIGRSIGLWRGPLSLTDTLFRRIATSVGRLIAFLPGMRLFGERLRTWGEARSPIATTKQIGPGRGTTFVGGPGGVVTPVGPSGRGGVTRGSPLRGGGGLAGAAEGVVANEVVAGLDKGAAKGIVAKGLPKLFTALKGAGRFAGEFYVGIALADSIYKVFTTEGSVKTKLKAGGETLANDLTLGLFKTSEEQHKEWSKSLDKAKKKIEEAVGDGNYSLARKLARDLKSSADEFKRFGKKDVAAAYDEVADAAVAGIRRVKSSLKGELAGIKLSNQVSEDGKVTDKEIAKIAKRLAKLPPEGQKAARQTMVNMFHSFEEHGELPQGAADDLVKGIDRSFARMARRAGRRIVGMMKDFGIGFGGMADVARGALQVLGGNLNETLKSLGLKKLTFDLKKPEKSAASGGALLGSVVSALGQARGGWIGRRGQRGGDAGLYALGAGEGVINAPHQAYIEPAMHAYYGHGLDTMFNRVHGEHGTPLKGGLASGRPAGIVPIPGQPGEFIARSILRDVLKIIRRYKAKVTDGYSTSGVHAAGGEHPKGLAVDLIPDFGHGGNWGLITKLANWAEPTQNQPRKPFRWVGYTGDPNHGPGNHLHLSWGGGGILGALGGILGDIARVRIGGGHTALHRIAQRVSDRARAGANKFLGEQGGGDGFESTGTTAGGLSRSAVTRIINMAMGLVGVTKSLRGAWRGMSLARSKQESGWDPNVQNNWDSNAKAGTPSIGLFQTIGPTFSRWALPGMRNIRNPLDNTVAAFRYMFGNYGGGKSWALALARMIGRVGVGYASGGGVPGYGGGDRWPIMAEGGEHIWSKEEVSKAGGHGVMRALRAMLGGGGQGGPTAFAPGGQVNSLDFDAASAITTQREREARRLGINAIKLSDDSFRSIRAILVDVKAVSSSIANLRRGAKGVNNFLKLTDKLISEGGFFDELRAAIERRVTRAQRRLLQGRFAVGPGRVVTESQDAVGQAQGNLDIERDTRGRLAAERRQIHNALRRVQRRQGSSKLSPAQKRALQTEENELRTRAEDADQRSADNVQAIFDAQTAVLEAAQQAQQDVVDKITKNYERQASANDIFRRMATALGNEDWLVQINSAQRDILTNQANELEGRIANARASGNNELADQLVDQVADLRTQVFESIQQSIRDAMERINNRATRRLGRLDLGNRMLDASGIVGQTGAAAVGGERFTRAGIFAQRGDALAAQRRDLGGLVAQASAQGNIGLVDELNDQIAELEVAIKENTKAAFQAKLDAVNNTAQYGMQVNDLNAQILTLTGQISGNTDTAKLLALAQQKGNILATQRQGLEALLAEAQAAGDQQAVQDLTVAMLENTVASLQNTQAVNELAGQAGADQGFTTTAFELFSQAIFNGSGGLLPQYANVLPGAAAGAAIMRTGALVGHRGETIVPAHLARVNGENGSGDTLNFDIDIHEAGRPIDTGKLASDIMFKKSGAK